MAKNTQSEPQTDAQAEDRLKQQLYSKALRTLRENHHDEFIEIVSGLYAEHGLTYQRRLSPQEKAEKQVRELLDEHPELAEKFGFTNVSRSAGQ